MEVRATRTNDVSQQVEVEIEEKEILAATHKKLQRMAKTVRIDGFRQGKVPVNVIRQRFGSSARAEAIEETVNTKVYEALQSDELNKTIQFSRPEVSEGVASGNVVFTFVAENFPEFTPKDYKGVAVELVRSEVEDAAIDAEVDRLREELTALKPVEGRTAVEADDVVRISFKGLGEGPQSELSQEDQEVDLSEESLIPGMVEGLVGAEKDAKTVVTVTLPEDFGLEELKGQDIDLEIEVHDILVRQAPELDDSFAKETGKADTYAELRETIREELLTARKKANEDDARRRMLDIIGESNAVTVPPMYLNTQSQQQVMEQLQMFERQGINWQDLDLDIGSLVQASERDMEGSLARSLLLQAIAKEEDIDVNDEDVDAEIKKLAEENDIPESQVLASMGGDDAKDQLRFRLQMDRVLDFVWSEGTITEVDELPTAEDEDSDAADGEEV